MKVGDLVTWKNHDVDMVGLIVEIGKYAGNGDVKVLWSGIDSYEPHVQNSKFLKLLTSS